MSEKIIVALDADDVSITDSLLKNLQGHCQYFKVGLQAYYSQGNTLIKKIKDQGAKVFLDLKLHDIPNTVKNSLKVLSDLEVDMVNIHALGGIEMMKLARTAVSDKTKLIAVTMLTSHESQFARNYLFSSIDTPSMATNLAKMAKESGLSGVVCSPLEVQTIKKYCGKAFVCVTPGVRPIGSSSQDQKRFTTPAQAMVMGSDFLVIGRPITQSADPKTSFMNISKEIS